ncbi:MAG: SseB family protein [Streptosporangiaceae bacterium]|nr:SseB family protein [Streptosporangiaceae bacterium]
MKSSGVPADPTPTMAHGGTFVRPGALAWGRPDAAAPARDAAIVEEALATAVKDPGRVTDLLDQLRQARLWLPLPADGPVTDGSAVHLPTVTYLGAEFVPAFTSHERLVAWPLGNLVPPQGRPAQAVPVPHIVVAAAELARRLPAGTGIALNPGAEASVPIYPEGIGYLAGLGTAEILLGHPPADPLALLGEVRARLALVAAVRHASRAWLSVAGRGEGLILSVTLRDPASEVAQRAVIEAIEQAAAAVPHRFPIDVTFPGEYAADEIDEWIAAHAEPFYLREHS